MTTTSTTQGGGSISAIVTGRSDTLAYVNLAAIAVFAVVVVIAILAGVRLRARRKAAERANRARLDTEATSPVTRDETTPIAPPLAGLDERIAATPALNAAAAAEAADVAPPADATPVAPGLPLTTLKGLGPKAATRLAELGVPDVPALALLTATQAAAIDAELGPFQGRMTRDRWIEQAQLLARGETAEYEALFGKLGG